MGSALARVYAPVLKQVLKSTKTKPVNYTLEAGCVKNIGTFLKEKGHKRVLIITDASIRKLGLIDNLEKGLREAALTYTVFDNILPNPTVSMCKEGKRCGLDFHADCAVSIGGGSVLDCGKIVCAAIKTPDKSVEKLCGAFAAKDILPHYAVPTTAGTGAEVSMGAVISNDASHRKLIACAPAFTYDHIFIDGELMAGMPKGSTAACGIDALSHAIETYVSALDNEEGGRASLEAARIIMKNLPLVVKDGKNLEARNQMAYAAMIAGIGLNKQMAGYAHAYAHAIGGKYNLPHGNMIGATLIPILEFEKDACQDKLAKLSVACGFGSSSESSKVLADRFVKEVRNLRDSIGLVATIPQLKEEDISELLTIMFKDALNYLVPRYLNDTQAREIMKGLIAK